MRGALQRHLAARGISPGDLDAAGISAVEFMNWACAVDERLRLTDRHYAVRRDADPDGKHVLALRHVRDRHMHQVVVSTDVDDTPFFGGKDGGGFGPPFHISAGIIWRSADEIGDAGPDRRTKALYVARRAAYRSLMEGRNSSGALSATLRWLTTEVECRGVDLPT